MVATRTRFDRRLSGKSRGNLFLRSIELPAPHPVPLCRQSGTGLSATKTFAYLRMLARPGITSQVALQFSRATPP